MRLGLTSTDRYNVTLLFRKQTGLVWTASAFPWLRKTSVPSQLPIIKSPQLSTPPITYHGCLVRLELGCPNCGQACILDSWYPRFVSIIESHCAGVCISRRVLQSNGYKSSLTLSDAGYFVTAPDLLGHGNARRSSDYTIAALAEELRPFFTKPGGNDHPYDIVVGYSLGGVVASALLPILKSTRRVQVVLIDPPLEQTPDEVAFHRKFFGDAARNPNTPEGYQLQFPFMTKEDTIFFWLSKSLCDASTVEAILDVGLLHFL